MTNFGEAALVIARGEIGVKEDPPGSNTGPRVRVYLDGHPPEPWCADFVTWCLRRAGFPAPTWNRSYCPSWVEAVRAGLAGMIEVSDPQPGDLVLFDWDGGVADHVGFVERIDGPDEFWSIEGNTSYGDNSNGGQVMRRARFRSDVELFARMPAMPRMTLAQRLAAAGYGEATVPVILRRLAEGFAGTRPNPGDSRMFRNLRAAGLGAASARTIIRSLRAA